jgi:hypothetical protein
METTSNMKTMSSMETAASMETTSNVETTSNMETASDMETASTMDITSDDKCTVCAKDCDGVACELCEAISYCGDACEEADLYVLFPIIIKTGKTN